MMSESSEDFKPYSSTGYKQPHSGCLSKLAAELKLLHIGAHGSRIRLLACFLHGHNAKHIFSEQLACREPGEPGNSWWRRIRSGQGEWSRMGRAAPGPREKSSAVVHTSRLTHTQKNPHRSGDKWIFTSLFSKDPSEQIMYLKVVPVKSVLQQASLWCKNDGMNALQANTIDGKSMICMQFSSSSSETTAPDNAWTKNIHRARDDQRLQECWHTALIPRDASSDSRILEMCKQKGLVQLSRLNTTNWTNSSTTQQRYAAGKWRSSQVQNTCRIRARRHACHMCLSREIAHIATM